MFGHALTRILCATAPTLRHLHIFCHTTRTFLLPSVNLPHLQELVVEGPYNTYNDEDFTKEKLTAFGNLRRLRLTCVKTTDAVRDNTLKTIVASAPNLTHLRLDHSSLYSPVVFNAIQNFLPSKPIDEFDPVSSNSASHEQFSDSQRLTPLPRCLRRILLHPGGFRWPSGYRICGFANRMLRNELENLASADSRIILFKETSFTTVRPAWKPQTGLDEWVDRINGGQSYWSSCNAAK